MYGVIVPLIMPIIQYSALPRLIDLINSLREVISDTIA